MTRAAVGASGLDDTRRSGCRQGGLFLRPCIQALLDRHSWNNCARDANLHESKAVDPLRPRWVVAVLQRRRTATDRLSCVLQSAGGTSTRTSDSCVGPTLMSRHCESSRLRIRVRVAVSATNAARDSSLFTGGTLLAQNRAGGPRRLPFTHAVERVRASSLLRASRARRRTKRIRRSGSRERIRRPSGPRRLLRFR